MARDGVFIRMAAIPQSVSRLIFFELKPIPPTRYFLIFDITVFDVMSRIENIPVARRSSVISAKPFFIASRGFELLIFLP